MEEIAVSGERTSISLGDSGERPVPIQNAVKVFAVAMLKFQVVTGHPRYNRSRSRERKRVRVSTGSWAWTFKVCRGSTVTKWVWLVCIKCATTCLWWAKKCGNLEDCYNKVCFI